MRTHRCPSCGLVLDRDWNAALNILADAQGTLAALHRTAWQAVRVEGGYRLDLNPAALGLPIALFIRIRPNPGALPRIAEPAQQIPEVVECHRVTGEDCFVKYPQLKQWASTGAYPCGPLASPRNKMFNGSVVVAVQFRSALARMPALL